MVIDNLTNCIQCDMGLYHHKCRRHACGYQPMSHYIQLIKVIMQRLQMRDRLLVIKRILQELVVAVRRKIRRPVLFFQWGASIYAVDQSNRFFSLVLDCWELQAQFPHPPLPQDSFSQTPLSLLSEEAGLAVHVTRHVTERYATW